MVFFQLRCFSLARTYALEGWIRILSLVASCHVVVSCPYPIG
jgi:hypothetical protein